MTPLKDILSIVKELQALEAKAKPGPWHQYQEGKDRYQNGGLVGPFEEEGSAELWGGYDGNMADRDTIEFIAQSRNAFPALASHILAQEEKLKKEKKRVNENVVAHSECLVDLISSDSKLAVAVEALEEIAGDRYSEARQEIARKALSRLRSL